MDNQMLTSQDDDSLHVVMDFLSLSIMADMTTDTLDTVGAMDGGLDMSAITPIAVIEPTPDLSFSIDSPIGIPSAPAMPTPSLTS